jgi:hypothetical protein
MTRNARAAVALLFTGAVLAGGSSPLTAGTQASPARGVSVTTSVSQLPAQAFDGFRLSFDNGESLRPKSRVGDASGNGHRATVVVSGRGRISRVDGVRGSTAAGFPSPCGRCGRAILQIDDRPALDPRRASFRFGAMARVTALQTPNGRDPNLVQKGFDVTPGGQFKLELIGSRPRCVVAGSAGRVMTPRGPSVADGRWHRLACTRTGGVVTLRLDGALVAQAKGATGSLSNAVPVRIGGKAVGRAGADDQYHGHLDNVFLSIIR